MKKPYAIFRYNQYQDREGLWERYRKYETMDAAVQALIDLTRKPKKDRIFLYTIFPNEGQHKWVLIKDHEGLLKTAR